MASAATTDAAITMHHGPLAPCDPTRLRIGSPLGHDTSGLVMLPFPLRLATPLRNRCAANYARHREAVTTIRDAVRDMVWSWLHEPIYRQIPASQGSYCQLIP